MISNNIVLTLFLLSGAGSNSQHRISVKYRYTTTEFQPQNYNPQRRCSWATKSWFTTWRSSLTLWPFPSW